MSDRDFSRAFAVGQPVTGFVRSLNREERRLASQVAKDQRHLHRFEHSVFSQNGEDGIIAEIFNRIGPSNRQFIEIGAATGEQNCTAALVEEGWGGLWIEGDPAKAEVARERLAGRPVDVAGGFVDAATAVDAVSESRVGSCPDLLVIDIDGNDYWVWKSLSSLLHPRVVVIEYNAVVGPRSKWVLPYDPRHRWDDTCRHGAGLAALERLGRSVGLELVGCDSRGVNAFFVVKDRADLFTRKRTSGHYVAPRHGLPFGHPVTMPPPVDTPVLSQSDMAAVRMTLGTWPPRTVRPGGLVYVELVVHNRSDVIIGHPTTTDRPCFPVAWWTDHSVRVPAAPDVSFQPWCAAPGERAHLVGRATAPSEPGRYGLVFDLTQHGVGWHGGEATVYAGSVTVRR